MRPRRSAKKGASLPLSRERIKRGGKRHHSFPHHRHHSFPRHRHHSYSCRFTIPALRSMKTMTIALTTVRVSLHSFHNFLNFHNFHQFDFHHYVNKSLLTTAMNNGGFVTFKVLFTIRSRIWWQVANFHPWQTLQTIVPLVSWSS